jgi:hypothetical protein
MKHSSKSLVLAAAFAGLLGGTSARLNAQPTSHNGSSALMQDQTGKDQAGTQAPSPGLPKHSCKGKNDCKGQGGGDAKHAGKNSCKGKGACATDGSKPQKS